MMKAKMTPHRKFVGEFELLQMEVQDKGGSQLLHIELQHSEDFNIYDININIAFVKAN